MRAVVAIAGLLLGACFNPSYNDPTCGPSAECPSGYTCGADNLCTKSGGGDLDGGLDSVDGAPDAPAPFCENPNFLMCEDFESFPLGTVPSSASWVLEKTGIASDVTIDGTHAMGQRALRIQAAGTGNFTRTVIRKNLSLPNNSGFGRLRIWLAAIPVGVTSGFLHMSFASAWGGNVRMNTNDTSASSGMPTRWMVNGQVGTGMEWTRVEPTSGPVTIAAGRFMCLEFEVNNAAQEIRVWVDGAARNDLVANVSTAGSAFAFAQPIDRIEFGFTRYQQSNDNADVWLDDLVISKTRVGCP